MKYKDYDTIDFFERTIDHALRAGFNVCAHVLEHYIGEELFYRTALKIFPNESLSDINAKTKYLKKIKVEFLLVDFDAYGINGIDLVPLINNDILTGKLKLQRRLDDGLFGKNEDQCNRPLFSNDMSYLITYLPEHIMVDGYTLSKILELAGFDTNNKPVRNINQERLCLYMNSDNYEHYRYKLAMEKKSH